MSTTRSTGPAIESGPSERAPVGVEEAGRYRFLADAIPLILWTARPDGGLDYYNKAWLDYTGLTLRQTRDWGWGAVLHPDDLQRCVDRWTHAFTTGEDYEIEYRFRRGSDGAYRWFLGRASARRNEEGSIVQWVGTGTDIESQKQAEIELRSAQSQLENRVAERTGELANTNRDLQRRQTELQVLFDLMPAMIWFKDTNNRILRVNKLVADTAGLPVDEIEGRPTSEIYPKEAAKYYADDLEVIRTAEPKLGTIEMVQDAGGRELFVRTDKVPYCDRTGKVVGIAVMSQDVTESRRSAAELLESRHFLRSTLDALESHISILDGEGTIVEVNAAWARFAGANGLVSGHSGVGDNYLAACDSAAGDGAVDAGAAALGIRAVIGGETRDFHMEYACHGPGEQRWFILRVTRFSGEGPVRVVAAHENITARRSAEEQLRRKTALLEAQLNSSIDGVLVVNENRRVILRNQKMVELFDIPRHIAASDDDDRAVAWVAASIVEPERFVERISDLYSHPDAIVLDELELKNGRILDRYSSPVVGEDGASYGRIWAFRDVTERKRAERQLAESNQNFQELAGTITDVFWVRSADMKELRYISPAFERIWGRSKEFLYSHPESWADFVFPEDGPRVIEAFAALTADAPSVDLEYRIVRPNGEIRWVHARGFQIRDADGLLVRLTGIASDITERKDLDALLVQSQKMETVGRLAGGIAHEFNGILTSIIGQSEMLRNSLPAGGPLAERVAKIESAAGRATTLTRQLLAFGRRQFLQPETLDLGQVIGDMAGLFGHLLGRAIEPVTLLAPGLKAVTADLGQLEQVIASMLMNGKRAMPQGGRLTLETSNVSVGAGEAVRFPGVTPGEYVRLTITDTGPGMSKDRLARVFEPFSSTTGVGVETDLGLAMCFGIVKQSGGHIGVRSAPGQGTTFSIYLPQASGREKEALQRMESPELPRGSEAIIFVETDPDLRHMASTLMRELGYTVWASPSGEEALLASRQRGTGDIDLLFTELLLPGVGGVELAARLRASMPRMRVLFAAASMAGAALPPDAPPGTPPLLRKPFSPTTLAQALRRALADDREAAPELARGSSRAEVG
jgi:PAS domain S-box-containing protein